MRFKDSCQSLAAQNRMNIENETDLQKWRKLYFITGIASMVMLVLIAVQIAVYTLWPMPKTTLAWFQLFQSNWVLGLLHLDVIYIINNTIVALMYIAFYLSLKKRNESLMLIALVFGLLAIAAYYASNPAFEMLSLSQQFAESATEAERVAYFAIAQALILQWKGTAFDIYYILSAICLIIIACVMKHSILYGKRIAVIGLSSGLLMLIPSTSGTIGVYFALASLVPWAVFSWLAAIRFLNLGAYKSSS